LIAHKIKAASGEPAGFFVWPDLCCLSGRQQDL